MLKSDAINTPSVMQFGHKLHMDLQESEYSFEGAAQQVAERIYNGITQPNGSPMFALVQVFRICTADELFVGRLEPARKESEYWLALMGTYGSALEWRGRTLSLRYRQMPVTGLSDPVMIAALDDLRLHPEKQGVGYEEDTVKRSGIEAHTFYIEDAVTSPIMATDYSMVSKYGIKSVMGFGMEFPWTGSDVEFHGCVTLMFSKVQIDEAMHTCLTYLGISLNTLFGKYERTKPLWDGF